MFYAYQSGDGLRSSVLKVRGRIILKFLRNTILHVLRIYLTVITCGLDGLGQPVIISLHLGVLLRQSGHHQVKVSQK